MIDKQEIEKHFAPIIKIFEDLGCSNFEFHYPYSPDGDTYVALTFFAPDGDTIMHGGAMGNNTDEIKLDIDKTLLKISKEGAAKAIIDKAMSDNK